MDIEKYVSEGQRRLEKSKDQIQNFDVFDFNYIPDKPLMREEVKPVIDALLRYRQTGIANNVLILGCRGSGKSVLAKYLMNLLSQQGQFNFAYANCREHNTSFKILAFLLGLRPRGCTLSELWYKFEDSSEGKIVFILDEIDFLVSDKDKGKDILYLISRSSKNYMAFLLSNNPKFLKSLDESIKSTLQPEIIYFRSYNAGEIEKILIDRAKVGLKSLPIGIIREIAAMTVKNTNSDVRIAIKTLYWWALQPDVPLSVHFEKARQDITYEVIRDLNYKNLLILKAALSCQSDFVKEIYQTYIKISAKFNEESGSYVSFYSNLSYLQSLGLILLISTKVNRVYTNRIQLTFDPSIFTTIWRMRFG